MDYNNIPKEKFAPANNHDVKHDKKLDTKPVGYFKDALIRFCKNKGSVVAFVIISLLILFAIIVPFLTPYTVAYEDTYFSYCYPRNELCVQWGWDFWDGCAEKTYNEQTYLEYLAIGTETGNSVVKDNEYEVSTKKVGGYFIKDSSGSYVYSGSYYTFRFNSYHKSGCVKVSLTAEQYAALQQYQDEHQIQIIYPAINRDEKILKAYPQHNQNYNAWFEWEEVYTANAKGERSTKKTVIPKVLRNEDGSFALDENGNIQFVSNYTLANGKDGYTSVMLIEGDVKQYNYSVPMAGGLYEVRVNYYEYYKYVHDVPGDKISEPRFLFGTTHTGKDILTCLASGARLSFLLAIAVSSVNMIVGAIYGAIEGYYGGKLDLFMERFSDILSAVPFMIVISLLKMHMGKTPQLLILFIAFFLTGWIGMAGRVHMQFYRFKNQEYVLAARTLGAKDRRIMFKHIFPNSLGTIITGSILSIPGMIFSESSLSYLGIINLSTGNMTSVGNLLASAQNYLTTFPHMMLFPALFICLLMLCFNLFGNGLRDAFNPSLRGAED